jgi:hypothetical protein
MSDCEWAAVGRGKALEEAPMAELFIGALAASGFLSLARFVFRFPVHRVARSREGRSP